MVKSKPTCVIRVSSNIKTFFIAYLKMTLLFLHKRWSSRRLTNLSHEVSLADSPMSVTEVLLTRVWPSDEAPPGEVMEAPAADGPRELHLDSCSESSEGKDRNCNSLWINSRLLKTNRYITGVMT